MSLDFINAGLVLSSITTLLFIVPILDSIERKVKAAIHSRIGPPILQTWYDIRKLFAKKLSVIPNPFHVVFFLFLYTMLSIMSITYFITAVLVPMWNSIMVLIILITILQTTFIVLPFVTSNPFAIIGATREVLLVLVNEIVFFIAMALLIFFSGETYLSSLPYIHPTPAYLILAAILFIVGYVSCGRQPFDIAEAEPEIASGILVELTGPLLGVFVYANLVRRALFKLIPVYVLIAPFTGSNMYALITSLIILPILWVIYAGLAALFGRSRVDIAPVSLLKLYSILFSITIILYLVFK